MTPWEYSQTPQGQAALSHAVSGYQSFINTPGGQAASQNLERAQTPAEFEAAAKAGAQAFNQYQGQNTIIPQGYNPQTQTLMTNQGTYNNILGYQTSASGALLNFTINQGGTQYVVTPKGEIVSAQNASYYYEGETKKVIEISSGAILDLLTSKGKGAAESLGLNVPEEKGARGFTEYYAPEVNLKIKSDILNLAQGSSGALNAKMGGAEYIKTTQVGSGYNLQVNPALKGSQEAIGEELGRMLYGMEAAYPGAQVIKISPTEYRVQPSEAAVNEPDYLNSLAFGKTPIANISLPDTTKEINVTFKSGETVPYSKLSSTQQKALNQSYTSQLSDIANQLSTAYNQPAQIVEGNLVMGGMKSPSVNQIQINEFKTLLTHPEIPEYVKEDYRSAIERLEAAPSSSAGYSLNVMNVQGGNATFKNIPFGEGWNIPISEMSENAGYITGPPIVFKPEALKAASVGAKMMAAEGKSVTLQIPTEGGGYAPILFSPKESGPSVPTEEQLLLPQYEQRAQILSNIPIVGATIQKGEARMELGLYQIEQSLYYGKGASEFGEGLLNIGSGMATGFGTGYVVGLVGATTGLAGEVGLSLVPLETAITNVAPTAIGAASGAIFGAGYNIYSGKPIEENLINYATTGAILGPSIGSLSTSLNAALPTVFIEGQGATVQALVNIPKFAIVGAVTVGTFGASASILTNALSAEQINLPRAAEAGIMGAEIGAVSGPLIGVGGAAISELAGKIPYVAEASNSLRNYLSRFTPKPKIYGGASYTEQELGEIYRSGAGKVIPSIQSDITGEGFLQTSAGEMRFNIPEGQATFFPTESQEGNYFGGYTKLQFNLNGMQRTETIPLEGFISNKQVNYIMKTEPYQMQPGGYQEAPVNILPGYEVRGYLTTELFQNNQIVGRQYEFVSGGILQKLPDYIQGEEGQTYVYTTRYFNKEPIFEYEFNVQSEEVKGRIPMDIVQNTASDVNRNFAIASGKPFVDFIPRSLSSYLDSLLGKQGAPILSFEQPLATYQEIAVETPPMGIQQAGTISFRPGISKAFPDLYGGGRGTSPPSLTISLGEGVSQNLVQNLQEKYPQAQIFIGDNMIQVGRSTGGGSQGVGAAMGNAMEYASRQPYQNMNLQDYLVVIPTHSIGNIAQGAMQSMIFEAALPSIMTSTAEVGIGAALASNIVAQPSINPNPAISITPVVNPSLEIQPSITPTISTQPTITSNPVVNPTVNPVVNPTVNPVVNPTVNPVVNPTVNPFITPKIIPTLFPPKSGGYEEKRRKKKIILSKPRKGPYGKREILSDILSSMHSENVYGRATSISLKEHPEYQEMDFGKVPTREELQNKGSGQGIGAMGRGLLNRVQAFGGFNNKPSNPNFALGGSNKFSNQAKITSNNKFAIGGNLLKGNKGKPKWKWI